MWQNLLDQFRTDRKKVMMATKTGGGGRALQSSYINTDRINHPSVENGGNTILVALAVAENTSLCLAQVKRCGDDLFHPVGFLSDINELRPSGYGVHLVSEAIDSGLLVLLYLTKISSRLLAQLKFMKRVKVKKSLVATFLSYIEFKVQKLGKELQVSKLGVRVLGFHVKKVV